MREERVEFRTSHQEKVQFEMAANYLGMNLSAFLRMAALERSFEIVKEKSDEISQENEILLFSDRDRDLFLSALETPPKPNKHLKKAFSDYRKNKSKEFTVFTN